MPASPSLPVAPEPAGGDALPPRKQQLLDWASQNEAWIIEDDYDGEFHYTRKVLPSLKSLDQHDRVIFMGTFSKTIMPSLRMGYVVMPASTVGAFTDSADILTSGQPVLTQKILTAFQRRAFFRHLKRCARSIRPAATG